MAPRNEPRLVLGFAVASLIAFVVVGLGATALLVRNARERAEVGGAQHALFVSQSVLGPMFEGVDLTEPVTGETYERTAQLVRERVMSDGLAVRVKVWRLDGTIVFSDEPQLVGMRFSEEAPELEEVASGAIEKGISDLDEDENEFERNLADKLFYTYTPLRTDPGGPVTAVAEIYQDYSFIQQDIDAVVGWVAIIVAAGLAVLYALLLPLARRASAELRRRNEQLEQHLQREQATVAELRDLNQRKDDFVSAASHELRTPLTSILGVLGTLKQNDLGDDPVLRAELLEAAERQTKRLERLIANILSAARMDGDRPIEVETVDLVETARTVAADLGASDRVVVEIPQGTVATDRTRIVEVMTYLLENALKYSPADSTVTIGADSEKSGFRLWVTDHGVGIDPADQAAIFERFHQIDQTATRTHGGLGLGLHLAKDLVEELQGRVEVASRPGHGSTFTVIVPANGAHSRERSSAAAG
jgi:signal transduction histidine kinase